MRRPLAICALRRSLAAVALGLCALGFASPDRADLLAQESRSAPGRTKVVLLGTGTPNADFLREIREAGYEGRVVSGKDLEVY